MMPVGVGSGVPLVYWKLSPGCEQRLLADHALAADLDHAADAVGDLPVAGQQLDRLAALVLDPHPIAEHPAVLVRLGLVRDVERLDG